MILQTLNYRGYELSYGLKGQGSETFILIHNAGGDYSFLSPQIDYFSQKAKVLALDLRGHGQSDKPNGGYTVESFAEDIQAICDENNIQQAIIIGLNHGANIGVELAARSNQLVSHLIMIDPPLLLDDWVIELIENHIEHLKDPHYNFGGNLIRSVFFCASEPIKSLAHRGLEKVSRQALISTYQNLLKWDKTSSQKLQQCPMPILNIQTNQPFCEEAKLRQYCTNLMPGKVIGSGPWATLEVPEQVNSMIKRFLECSVTKI